MNSKNNHTIKKGNFSNPRTTDDKKGYSINDR